MNGGCANLTVGVGRLLDNDVGEHKLGEKLATRFARPPAQLPVAPQMLYHRRREEETLPRCANRINDHAASAFFQRSQTAVGHGRSTKKAPSGRNIGSRCHVSLHAPPICFSRRSGAIHTR